MSTSTVEGSTCVECGRRFMFDAGTDAAPKAPPPVCGMVNCRTHLWGDDEWSAYALVAAARLRAGVELSATDRRALGLPTTEGRADRNVSVPAAGAAVDDIATRGQAPAVATKRVRRTISNRAVFACPSRGEAVAAGGTTYTLQPGATVADMLDRLGSFDSIHVVDGTAEELRTAAVRAAPAGWEPGRHFLDDNNPLLRFTRGKRRVTISGAGRWCGSGGGYTAAQAAAGYALAEHLLRAAFDDGARLVGTPATTGRELFARTIPHDVTYPVLDEQTQQLIRSTSGQGRAELCQPAGLEISGMVELDMRLAYPAVCWGLPVGQPDYHDGVKSFDYEPMRRGRYLVDFTVPAGWEHVGLLGVHAGAGGWRWPRHPGEEGRAWVDGAELHLAHRHGWPFVIREALLWGDGLPYDPLRRWAERITDAAGRAEQLGRDGRATPEVAKVARAAIRAVVLHGIGGFVARSHDSTRAVALDGDTVPAGLVPADAKAATIVDGDTYVWREEGPAAWAEMAHPEWAAAIWGRTRARLLDGPPSRRGGPRTGALHLDPATVIGFRTDAIYSTEEPGWGDDGKPGRFVAKAGIGGPFTMPATLDVLDTLRGRGRAGTPADARAALNRKARK